MAKEANRYTTTNGDNGSRPHTTEPILADLEEIFETGSILIESLGFPIFKPFVDRTPAGEVEDDEDLWYLEGPFAKATGLFTNDGFTVLKGSKARADFVPSAEDTNFARKRERMIADGVLYLEGDSYVFNKDFPFNPPSGSAAIILARHSNGWNDWKNSESRTLDEVKRKTSTVDRTG